MSKPNSLCSADHLAKTALFAEWAPAALKGFQALAGGAFAAGALSVQDKEIIAFACAHVLRCPYCIDYHHGLATQAGATREALTEAVWVAIAMAACASAQPGPEQALRAATPAALDGYQALQSAAFAPGALNATQKALAAVACAHNLRCAFSIERTVPAALAAGASKAMVSEAIFVAIEMAAGACLGHAGLAAALME